MQLDGIGIAHNKQPQNPADATNRPGYFTISNKITITDLGPGATIEQKQAQVDSSAKAMSTYNFDLPSAADELFPKFGQLEKSISSLVPGLSHNDWGITLSKDNEVVVLGEELSDAQKTIVKATAEGLGIESSAKNFRDSLLRGMSQDRGPLESTTSIGKFNLTADNFDQVIDPTKAKDDSRLIVNPEFQVSDDKNGYESSSIIKALASQLAAKLEPQYGLHVKA